MPYRPAARAEVLAALIAEGGAVTDPKGFALRHLTEAYARLFHDRDRAGVSALVRLMVRDRQLRRVSRQSRRTHEISIGTVPDELAEQAVELLVGRLAGLDAVLDALTRSGLSDLHEHARTAEISIGPSRDARHLAAGLAAARTETAELRRQLQLVTRERDRLRATLDTRTEELAIAQEDATTLELDLQQVYRRLEALGFDLDELSGDTAEAE